MLVPSDMWAQYSLSLITQTVVQTISIANALTLLYKGQSVFIYYLGLKIIDTIFTIFNYIWLAIMLFNFFTMMYIVYFTANVTSAIVGSYLGYFFLINVSGIPA